MTFTIPTPVREIGTFLIALLGAVLGIINLLLTWKRGRVCVKVIPKSFFGVDPDTGTPDSRFYFRTSNGDTVPKYLCVDVINKGVATTVNEVGFLLKDTNERFVIMNQFPSRKIQIPFRLEPDSSVTVYADAFEADTVRDVAKFKCAYATVASGKRFTGRGQMFRMFERYADVID